MKNISSILLFAISTYFATIFGQGESVGPLTSNSQIESSEINIEKSALSNTFDSTFLYTTDTMSLPFFDEFSRKKLQAYSADFVGPNTTSLNKYSLVNNPIDMLPLPTNTKYSSQQGTLKTVNSVAGTTVITTIPPVSIGYNDLSSWPVIYNQTNVYYPYSLIDTVDFPNPIDTIFNTFPEYFQDSARQFFTELNDPLSNWLDSNAFHNYTYAINPISLGFMTFDGINSVGRPYNFSGVSTGIADYLTSKPIFLGSNSASDSIYFSFLYQEKGFGEEPDIFDELALEFFNVTNGTWQEVWSATGSNSIQWKVGHLRLIDPGYLQDGFQFRFVNTGNLNGALDHWHLDYVNLRAASGVQDTVFKDFAIVYPINTLLETYTSVPWDHFKASPLGKMATSSKFVVRNNSNLPENNQNGSIKIKFNGLLEGNIILPASSLSNGINYSPKTTIVSTYNFTSSYNFNPSVLALNEATFDIEANASAQFPNYVFNDSTFSKQIFKDYYSYDDGSAEAAYGVTGAQGMIAQRFEPYVNDSLLAVDFHFEASVEDVSQKLFFLTVWNDNNGKPGTKIYEDGTFEPRQPIYGNGKNKFIRYYLRNFLRLPTTGPIHIGWRQVDPNRLNIGYDRNINNSSNIHYSTNNGSTWIESTIPGGGTMMIRPVFNVAANATTSLSEEIGPLNGFTVYPNPTSNRIQVAGFTNEISLELVDLNGKKVAESNTNQLSLSDLTAGIYFLSILENNIKVQQGIKVIKQ